MRNINFILNEILPIILQESESKIQKKEAFLNLFLPFWTLMNIKICQTKINFQIAPNESV